MHYGKHRKYRATQKEKEKEKETLTHQQPVLPVPRTNESTRGERMSYGLLMATGERRKHHRPDTYVMYAHIMRAVV